MALRPELLKRRRRTTLPRAPHKGLGAGPKEADEELKELLEQLLAEAKNETLFTMTLESARLLNALNYAGFIFAAFYNFEGQIGPGGTITMALPCPAGFVLTPIQQTFYISLPWWLSCNIWIDSAPPALPIAALTRVPAFYEYKFESISFMTRFMLFNVTNNHAVNTANYLAIQYFDFVPLDTWRMIEEVYFKPIVEYAQEKAEEITGRPWP